MKNASFLRLLCVGCLVAVGVIAQAPPPAGGPGGGPGGGRGNFDPAQMMQRMLTGIEETLAATPDEWQVIKPLVTAVLEKQRTARELSGGRNLFRGRRGGPQPEQPAEMAAVDKAVEAGDAAVIKTALEALRKARADREAEVTKAKAALREVLSVGQEAKLVVMGLLD